MVEDITRDERLRGNLDQFIATHQDIGEKQYQYHISKLLLAVECTDVGNGIRFFARFGSMVRYVADWGRWYVWNGVRWENDTTERIKFYAKQVGAYLEMEADLLPSPTGEDGEPLMMPTLGILDTPTPAQKIVLTQFAAHDAQVAAIKKWGKQSRSDKGIKAMISLLRSEPGVTIAPVALDADDYLYNMVNGTFDLRTYQLLPHKKEHLITKLSPIEYDPTATCEVHWKPFINKVTMRKPGVGRFLKQLSGMGLCGVITDDIFPVHHGRGGNGKTIWSMALYEMHGDYCAIAEASIFIEKQYEGISNDLAALSGVRFLIASETDDNKHLNEALVKRLTGGDPITARFLRQEYFTFIPKFTVSLLVNPKPVIKGTDGGIWRRVKFIPWEYNFEDDPESADKPVVMARMRTELPGIFNWCVEGYRDRMENGLQVPVEVVEATNNYRAESDIIGAFIEECCILGKHEEVESKDLFKAYQEYMEPTGHNAFADNRFGGKVRDRQLHDPVQRKSGPRRYWLGIRLKTQAEKDAEMAEAFAEERAHTRKRTAEQETPTTPPPPVHRAESAQSLDIDTIDEKYILAMQQARGALSQLPVDYVALTIGDGKSKPKEELNPNDTLKYLTRLMEGKEEKWWGLAFRTIQEKLPVWHAAAKAA
jgi:putative DNA primase/helicase